MRRLDRSFGDREAKRYVYFRRPAELLGMAMEGDNLMSPDTPTKVNAAHTPRAHAGSPWSGFTPDRTAQDRGSRSEASPAVAA
jgi:hypothetical protein